MFNFNFRRMILTISFILNRNIVVEDDSDSGSDSDGEDGEENKVITKESALAAFGIKRRQSLYSILVAALHRKREDELRTAEANRARLYRAKSKSVVSPSALLAQSKASKKHNKANKDGNGRDEISHSNTTVAPSATESRQTVLRREVQKTIIQSPLTVSEGFNEDDENEEEDDDDESEKEVEAPDGRKEPTSKSMSDNITNNNNNNLNINSRVGIPPPQILLPPRTKDRRRASALSADIQRNSSLSPPLIQPSQHDLPTPLPQSPPSPSPSPSPSSWQARRNSNAPIILLNRASTLVRNSFNRLSVLTSFVKGDQNGSEASSASMKKMCDFEDEKIKIPGCHGNSIIKFDILEGGKK